MSKEIEVREPVKWFAGEMEKQLKANDHKGGWDNCGIAYLFGRLNEEVNELGRNSHNDYEAIIKEAVDVANFAMMIADISRRKVGESSE